ncbi:hypothetical protein GCM10009574_039680 [Streptomyces asiaticus]|uniref:Uncharacterized protein n=2 Tax=Streptomyces rhizosphaericus TaxID=114699 RepID=A0ABN1R7J3_9ACTN
MRWADGTAVVTHSPAPAATTAASRGTVRVPRVTEGPLCGWLDMCADIYQVLMGALRVFGWTTRTSSRGRHMLVESRQFDLTLSAHGS